MNKKECPLLNREEEHFRELEKWIDTSIYTLDGIRHTIAETASQTHYPEYVVMNLLRNKLCMGKTALQGLDEIVKGI